jgi:hypothetical protein
MSIRSAYQNIAESAFEAAMSRQSPQTQNKNDSLRAIQKESKERIDASLRYFDTASRMQFFSRIIGAVKEDVEYALANAQRLSSTQGSVKMLKNANEKEKKIDEEIKKLEQQIKNLPKK